MDDKAIHKQRKKNNITLGLLLGGFVVLVFFITMAKLRSGTMIEGFDHSVRPNLAEQE